ncbi:hypothetical protein CSA56_14990 [candidate division KSB3 bacterium]|uniref:Uncharacterized protein n=1 Tax=candidate division KSB3 bacterium TaxID=2044937 RepID=A0A2G6KAA7_9BACT|nr:MAG: hypothetical protein CSA56_14990 [candidate division KSB3 bacterium]
MFVDDEKIILQSLKAQIKKIFWQSLCHGIDVVLTLYHNKLKHGIDVIRDYPDVPMIPCYLRIPPILKQGN